MESGRGVAPAVTETRAVIASAGSERKKRGRPRKSSPLSPSAPLDKTHKSEEMQIVLYDPAVAASAGLEKKKRGRPRKSSLLPPSAPPAKREKRPNVSRTVNPNKRQKKTVGDQILGGSTSSCFAQPRLLTIGAGEDIMGALTRYAQQAPGSFCVLSATGTVSNVSVHKPDTSTERLTYEGLFEILSLRGSFTRGEGVISISFLDKNERVKRWGGIRNGYFSESWEGQAYAFPLTSKNPGPDIAEVESGPCICFQHNRSKCYSGTMH